MRVYRNQWTGPRPLADRFWEKVDKRGRDECWLWTGSLGSTGYGQLGLSNRGVGKAHRVAWELVHGPIPAGMNVLHRCDERRCVNARHLFLGSLRDNAQDMYAKGRAGGPIAVNATKTHCIHGHPFDAANTRLRANGNRACKACSRIRAQVQRDHINARRRERWAKRTALEVVA